MVKGTVDILPRPLLHHVRKSTSKSSAAQRSRNENRWEFSQPWLILVNGHKVIWLLPKNLSSYLNSRAGIFDECQSYGVVVVL